MVPAELCPAGEIEPPASMTVLREMVPVPASTPLPEAVTALPPAAMEPATSSVPAVMLVAPPKSLDPVSESDELDALTVRVELAPEKFPAQVLGAPAVK